MKKKVALSVVFTIVLSCAALVYAHPKFSKLRGFLVGTQEVPVVMTAGHGTFEATISKDENSISYELTYSDLESTVTQAHIHVGQPNVNGGIVVWLCGNSPPTSPPAGTQTCPPSGTITGTITGANIVGPASQGVTAGEMDTLIEAIRDGNTYVNVHTVVSPGGEIRSQIEPGKGKDNNHGKH
jgi:hypothetical protein